MSTWEILLFGVWVIFSGVVNFWVFKRRIDRGESVFSMNNLDAAQSMAELPGSLKVERAIRAVEAAERAPHEGRLGFAAEAEDSVGALSPADHPGGLSLPRSEGALSDRGDPDRSS